MYRISITLRWSQTVLLTASLASCVSFDPAEHRPYTEVGAGEIVGRITVDWHDKVYGYSTSVVKLTPATEFAERWYEKRFLEGDDPSQESLQLEPYVRETDTDSEHRFSFTNIPDGDWIVTGYVTIRVKNCGITTCRTLESWAASGAQVTVNSRDPTIGEIISRKVRVQKSVSIQGGDRVDVLISNRTR